MRKIGIDGEVGSIKVIDEVSTERSTGFPQIEEFNDDVFISWTDNSQANKIVKVTKNSSISFIGGYYKFLMKF